MVPEPTFGLNFWVDFLKEALAAIAGVGAWLGAHFAFGLERRKAAEDRKAAAAGAAAELAERRATAGNLAIFTLSQIHNDLLLYDLQLLAPAKASPAPWFYLVPTAVDERNFYRFDVPSLAFLLESKYPDAPEMLMRLALEQDRYGAFLDTVRRRTEFHGTHIPPIIERLQRDSPPDRVFTDLDLQRETGPRIYAHLRNCLADIEVLLELGVESSKVLAEQLRALLMAELPGRTIIGFGAAAEAALKVGSPLVQARNKAAVAPSPPK